MLKVDLFVAVCIFAISIASSFAFRSLWRSAGVRSAIVAALSGGVFVSVSYTILRWRDINFVDYGIILSLTIVSWIVLLFARRDGDGL